jgi:hypothetical protein
MEADLGSEILCSLEYWMTDKVPNPRNTDCYLAFCGLKI